MKYMLGFAMLLALAGCDNKVAPLPNAPPSTPPKSLPSSNTAGPDGEQTKARNPELVAKYDAAYREARAAVKELSGNLNAETYAVAGARCYEALAIGIEYERAGYSLSDLKNRKDMNEWFKMWRTEAGKLTMADKQSYANHPEYKAAFEAYKKLGGN
jgi:hypothetical protein